MNVFVCRVSAATCWSQLHTACVEKYSKSPPFSLQVMLYTHKFFPIKYSKWHKCQNDVYFFCFIWFKILSRRIVPFWQRNTDSHHSMIERRFVHLFHISDFQLICFIQVTELRRNWCDCWTRAHARVRWLGWETFIMYIYIYAYHSVSVSLIGKVLLTLKCLEKTLHMQTAQDKNQIIKDLITPY